MPDRTVAPNPESPFLTVPERAKGCCSGEPGSEETALAGAVPQGKSAKQLDPEMFAAHIARLEALREVSLEEHDKYPPCIVRRGRC